jgi:hypothetical protein
MEESLVKTQLRIPEEMYERVKELADRNFRSANAEILYLVSLGLERAKEHASPDDVRQIVGDVLRVEMEKLEKRRKAEFLDAATVRDHRT